VPNTVLDTECSNVRMNTASYLPQPALFLSHGSPMIALQPGAAGLFMQTLGEGLRQQFGLPRAILALSAHTLAHELTFLAAPAHHAVHDFGRFDDRLFDMRYDAPGEPALALNIAQRLQDAGWHANLVPAGGLDHGNWTVLRYLFPQANVPILPLAWVPSNNPAQQFALGQLLSPLLDEGVLILASGSITHNLGRVFSRGMNVPAEQVEISDSKAFRQWMFEKSQARDWPALLQVREQAPFFDDMHPTDEHPLPWFIAAGAGGSAHVPQRLHESVTYGCLGMDAYAFGPQAASLAEVVL
jgi:4,5-DOPA dioxygenase extradiol